MDDGFVFGREVSRHAAGECRPQAELGHISAMEMTKRVTETTTDEMERLSRPSVRSNGTVAERTL